MQAFAIVFAVLPDRAETPAAYFRVRNDAVEWGIHRYGLLRFKLEPLHIVPSLCDHDVSASGWFPRPRS